MPPNPTANTVRAEPARNRQAAFPQAQAAEQTRTPLPSDVVAGAARRITIVAVVYAVVFTAVGPATALLVSSERSAFFTSAWRWVPSVASIAMALLVAAASWSGRVSAAQLVTLGLAFEVAGSFGIAAARYLDAGAATTAVPTVSWVAVWIMVFATVIPNPPRRVLGAALLSATAVPVVAAAGLSFAGAPASVAFLIRTFVPYLIVAVVATVAARVVFRLGTALTHARELGSYRLVERLGQGGMGEVWRAEHQFLTRAAAIKLIRQPLGQSVDSVVELRARFEREAQITSTLRSPHTIQLYDFGVTDDGAFYYVMELLEGFDLQALVERFGPIPVDRAVHFLTQVCDSLGEAHDLNLIHRDIKPANVFVCRYGRAADFIKVLDFGLAKPIVSSHGPTQSNVTGMHAARGTPAFMAPEQAMGDRPVDPRTDVYALGCLAHWLVTGKLVFEGATPLETLVRHVQAVPSPPSGASEFEIPPAFDALVLACLAKRPEDRPQSTDIVATRLRTLASGSWTPQDAHRWWDVHAPRVVAR